jgi:hypothetical protein
MKNERNASASGVSLEQRTSFVLKQRNTRIVHGIRAAGAISILVGAVWACGSDNALRGDGGADANLEDAARGEDAKSATDGGFASADGGGLVDSATADGGTATSDGGAADGGSKDSGQFDGGPLLGCGTGTSAYVKSVRSNANFGPGVKLWGTAGHAAGDATVAGELSGQETFGAGTPQATVLRGGQLGSPLVLRYDAAGNFKWGAVGAGDGTVLKVGTAADGAVIAIGYFNDVLTFAEGTPSQVVLGTPNNVRSGQHPFVAKWNAGGVFQWAKTALGARAASTAIAVAADGSSIVGGIYGDSSIANRVQFDNLNSLSSSGQWEQMYIVSYDATGAVRWVRQAGGPSRNEVIADGAATGDGGAIFAGVYGNGTSMFEGGRTPSLSRTRAAQQNYYLLKYSSAGDLEWLSSADGDSEATAVATNGAEIAVAVSGPAATTFADGTPGSKVLAAGARAIAYYTPQGSLKRLVPIMDRISIGGPRAVAIAPDGTVAVAGSYYSNVNFTLANGNLPLTTAGWDDSFVACMAPSAAGLAWLRSGRGILQDYGNAITLDGLGRILVAGSTRDGLTVETSAAGTTVLPLRENGIVQLFPR